MSDDASNVDRPDPPVPARSAAGFLAVVATYVYFLLFAQYGLVRLITERGGGAAEVDRAMAFMGVAGLVTSFMAAALLGRWRARPLLMAGFAGCAAAALLALAPGGMDPAAALVGVSIALVTVTLASVLRRMMPGPHFGLRAGLATGVAYALCNVPAFFDGPPVLQTLFSAGLAVVGLCAVARAGVSVALDAVPSPACPALRDSDMRDWGLASIVLALLALVWLDSTAFATIQHTLELKGRTWGGSRQQVVQGAVHLAAAVGAGWLADRGWFRGLLLAAFGLFALAFRMLEVWGGGAVLAGPLYAIGISFYSVALILFPSARPDAPGLVPARWRSGLLYGVAGWMGSALGVGMAQHLHRIPLELVLAAGTVIAAGLALASGPAAQRVRRAAALTCAIGAVGLLTALSAGGAPSSAASDPATRGREVYRREGCITCHSQYIRPLTEDVERWGPFHAPDFSEQPPLIGNRRQGPDLMNAGLRRSPDWHRRHLIDPRGISPGSRMPSYAHLFAGASSRGKDLVAYLASLGRDHAAARLQFTMAWEPPSREPGDASRGRAVFQRFCTPCHGPEGRGDGPQAAWFSRPAMNLRKGAFWYVGSGRTPDQETAALSRIVRFGVAGTSMPGHEVFSDRQVADVVAYLQQLVRSDGASARL
jgi:mono/diheme cytochrome c family protein